MENVDESGPWKASVAEGFTALQELEAKVDGNETATLDTLATLKQDMQRLGQKISSSGVSFGDSEFNGVDDCHQYLADHINQVYVDSKLSLPQRFNIGVMLWYALYPYCLRLVHWSRMSKFLPKVTRIKIGLGIWTPTWQR